MAWFDMPHCCITLYHSCVAGRCMAIGTYRRTYSAGSWITGGACSCEFFRGQVASDGCS